MTGLTKAGFRRWVEWIKSLNGRCMRCMRARCSCEMVDGMENYRRRKRKR